MPAPSRIRSYSKPGTFQVRATGADLSEISRELRRMNDKAIIRQFRTELRAAAAPLVPAVRTSIDAIPVKGTSGSTGLRARLKKAVTLRVRTSGKNAQVSILMSTAKMPSGQRALPAYMEGTKSPWRHPVFGNTDNWRQQDSHPFFYRTVRPLGAGAKVAVNKITADITRKIT
jgi:hypothetical protein